MLVDGRFYAFKGVRGGPLLCIDSSDGKDLWTARKRFRHSRCRNVCRRTPLRALGERSRGTGRRQSQGIRRDGPFQTSRCHVIPWAARCPSWRADISTSATTIACTAMMSGKSGKPTAALQAVSLRPPSKPIVVQWLPARTLTRTASRPTRRQRDLCTDSARRSREDARHRALGKQCRL